MAKMQMRIRGAYLSIKVFCVVFVFLRSSATAAGFSLSTESCTNGYGVIIKLTADTTDGLGASSYGECQVKWVWFWICFSFLFFFFSKRFGAFFCCPSRCVWFRFLSSHKHRTQIYPGFALFFLWFCQLFFFWFVHFSHAQSGVRVAANINEAKQQKKIKKIIFSEF